MVDKNKPFSWRPFKPSLCKTCHATCCTLPLEVKLEDLVGMGWVSPEQVADIDRKSLQALVKNLRKRGIIQSYRDSTGLFLMVSKPNGDCRFLNEERRCEIYDKRPQVCRKFPEKMGLRLGHCPYLPQK